MALRPSTQQEHERVLTVVREALDGGLADADLTLDYLARRCSSSPRSIQRALRAHNLSWRELRRQVRMEAALRALLRSRRVKAVARDVGYKPDNLSAPFLARYGLRPFEVRRVAKLGAQLRRLHRDPPRGRDLAARCRAHDRWRRLWDELVALQARAVPGTRLATELERLVALRPPARPVPRPRGRQRRHQRIEQAFLAAAYAQQAARPTANRSRASSTRGAHAESQRRRTDEKGGRAPR